MKNAYKQGQTRGFTLVEIMIVVAIIGLLAAIAIPSFQKARRVAQVHSIVNDIRVFDQEFQIYATTAGGFPLSWSPPGVVPPAMADAIDADQWSKELPCGGTYFYAQPIYAVLNYKPCIGIVWGPDVDFMTEVDEIIDDGNINTGRLRILGSLNFYYRMEM